MTPDLKSQLAVLRRRVTRINNRYAGREPGSAARGLDPLQDAQSSGDAERGGDAQPQGAAGVPGAGGVPPVGDFGSWRYAARDVHYNAEAFLDGQVVENQHGRFFLHERFFPAHKRHGSVEFSRLAGLPGDLLPAISSGEIGPCEPRRWAFLDTETTGLAGGTGTCAFLVGVGNIEERGFRVRLFFMRDYDEERAMLAALSAFLADYELLITYNGKAYDTPLLETRYRLARQNVPFTRLRHLDLLFAARRLWRLRLESCRLAQLENEILGVEREGDLPGEMIPYCYFEFLRTRQAFRLVPLFHHNVMDIVTLACLTAVLLPVFGCPVEAPLHHGEDWLGMARWLRRQQPESALALYQRAVDRRMADGNLFQALWEMSLIEKKLGRKARAVSIWRDLSAVKNAFRCDALVELAKHYEHAEQDHAAALNMMMTAQTLEPGADHGRRIRRLQRKAARVEQNLL